MRLSDVKQERVFDVLAAIVEPVSSIVEDKDIKAAFKSAKSGGFASKLKDIVPLLLTRHRDDVVAVLSAIDGTTPKEYVEGMTLASLMNDVLELVTDEVFVDFLPSETASSDGGFSGSITE